MLPALKGPCEQEAEKTRAGDRGGYLSPSGLLIKRLCSEIIMGSGIHCPEVALCFQRAVLQEESGRGALVGGS